MEPRALAAHIAVTTMDVCRGLGVDLALDETDVALERPKNKDHGDWATSIAMKVAKSAGTTPREFATSLADALARLEGIKSLDVAGPGFINITLEAGAAGEIVATIIEEGEAFGSSSELAGETINLEFVSANPTGPLHIGHTRWAALGDSLARVLKAAGASVASEFYINDAGSQMDAFGASILAALKGARGGKRK